MSKAILGLHKIPDYRKKLIEAMSLAHAFFRGMRDPITCCQTARITCLISWNAANPQGPNSRPRLLCL